MEEQMSNMVCGFTLEVDSTGIGFSEYTDEKLIELLPKYGTMEYEDSYSFSELQIKNLYNALYEVYEILKKYENVLVYYSDFGGSTNFKAELYGTMSPFKDCTRYDELLYLCKSLEVLQEMLYINRGRSIKISLYVG